jgi:TRAP-type mannitol/chloroaromatic compound transport system permease small subunit
MKRSLQTIDQISEWSGRIFSYLLLVTMLIIGFEVLMRIFGNPQIWAFDTSLFTAGVVYVVGGAYTHLKDRHVKMDVLYVRLSPRIQSLLDLITFPGFFVFCGILLWVGGVRGWESFLMGETLFTPFRPIVWPVRLMIPLGGLLIILQGLAKAVRDFQMVVRGERLD